jgi:hypothetical protein
MKMERRSFLAALAAPAVACLLKFDKEIRLLEGDDACSNTITVGHPEYFFPGDVLHIPRTGEHMMVTARKDGGLTVTRGFGNSKISPVVDDDPVWILGRMKQETEEVSPEAAKWLENELLPTIDLVKKPH